MHLESVELPKGVKAAHAARDYTLVTIVPPTTVDKADESASS